MKEYVRKIDPKIRKKSNKSIFCGFSYECGGVLGNTLPQAGRYEEVNLQLYQVFSYK